MSNATVSPTAVDETIRRIEEEHDLLRYTIDGWSAWALLRFPVQWTAGYDLVQHRRPWPRRERLFYAARDAAAWHHLRPAPYLLKTFTSGLTERARGRYRDVWFEDLCDVLGPGCRIETINNRGFLDRRRQAVVPANVTSTAIDVASAVLARARPPREAGAIAAAIQPHLAAAFPAAPLSGAWVANRLGLFHWQRQLYGRVLDRVRPGFILLADPCEHALVAAARERGILSFELQHGFIDPYHSAYSWTQYAERYRGQLPIADRLLLQGEHWRAQVTHHGFWSDAVRVVGSPRIDGYRGRRAAAPRGAAPTLVVTTQGLAAGPLIAFFSDFLRASGPAPLELVFKLHPMYDPDPAQFLRAFGHDARVRVVGGNEDPSTFELLARADWHLSISSTCHYEAVGLGVPTIILPFESHEFVRPLAEAGHAEIASDGAALARRIAASERSEVPPEAIDRYFKRDAVANICAVLEEAGIALPRNPDLHVVSAA
jgi:hypothetical protein